MTYVEQQLRTQLAETPPIDAPPELIDRALTRAGHVRRRRRMVSAMALVAVLVAGVSVVLRTAPRPTPVRVTDYPPRPPRYSVGVDGRAAAMGHGDVWVVGAHDLVSLSTVDSHVVSRVTLRGQEAASSVAVSRHAVWVARNGVVDLFDLDGVLQTQMFLGGTWRIAAGDDDVWLVTAGQAERLHPKRFQIIDRVPLPAGVPDATVVSPGALWVLSDRSTVVRVDRDTHRVSATLALPAEDFADIAWSAGALWAVSPTAGLVRIDGSNFTVNSVSAVSGTKVTTGAGRVWVIRHDGDGVLVSLLDATTLAPVTPARHVAGPFSLYALAAGDDALWLPSLDGYVVRLPVP